MPSYDGTKYFSMPWGNYKPVCEILSTWEIISHRIEQSNAIVKVNILKVIFYIFNLRLFMIF